MLFSKLNDTYSRIRLYANNTYWVLAEKFITLSVSFLVMIFVARYLGPEKFGLLSYTVSLSAIISVAGHMGLSGLVIREIVKEPGDEASIIGTTFILKTGGVALGYLFLVAYAVFYEGINSPAFYLILIAGAAILFKPLDVIEFWFHAFVQAKYVSLTRVMALILTSALKLTLVGIGASIMFFAFANLLHALIAAILMVIVFQHKSSCTLNKWRFDKTRAKLLLKQGWIIYLGTFFAIVYMKVDQIMLRWLSNMDEVGQYAVAAQLSEAWYFLPAAIVTTVFPKLIKLREKNEEVFYQRLQQLFDLLFNLALIVAIFTAFFSEWIVLLFFGDAYKPASVILLIHIWAGLFVFMRAGFSKWILIENVLIFSLITQGLGAIANVGLNLLLIPDFGAVGAAYATLISYALASFFALLLYRKTRKIFWMMCYAIFSPVRYLIRIA